MHLIRPPFFKKIVTLQELDNYDEDLFAFDALSLATSILDTSSNQEQHSVEESAISQLAFAFIRHNLQPFPPNFLKGMPFRTPTRRGQRRPEK